MRIGPLTFWGNMGLVLLGAQLVALMSVSWSHDTFWTVMLVCSCLATAFGIQENGKAQGEQWAKLVTGAPADLER